VSIQETFNECARVLATSAGELAGPLEDAIVMCLDCLDRGGKLLTCGNGGSAADAQHLTAELVCRFRSDRAALPSIALTANTSTLTAIGNDYGFEWVFARQVEALARSGDVLIAISTSGTSANVVEAARTAKTMGCKVVALTGAHGGELGSLADALLAVPSGVVARIQEIHGICIHILAEAMEEDALSKKSDPGSENGP